MNGGNLCSGMEMGLSETQLTSNRPKSHTNFASTCFLRWLLSNSMSQDKDGGTGGILMNVRETSAEKWLGDVKMGELIGEQSGVRCI